jgi:hypothetical protein
MEIEYVLQKAVFVGVFAVSFKKTRRYTQSESADVGH